MDKKSTPSEAELTRNTDDFDASFDKNKKNYHLSEKLSHLPLPDPERLHSTQKWVRRVTFVLLFAIVIFLIVGYRNKWFSSAKPLADFFFLLGVPGYVLSSLLVILNTIFPLIPGSLPSVAMFMAYGNLWGFLSVMGMTLLGSCLSFHLSRKFGATFVLSFVPKDLFSSLMEKIVDEKAATKLAIFAFLVPGVPDDATVMICGLTKMRFSRFLLLCLIFKPLPTFLYLFGFSSLLDFVFQWLLKVQM